MPNLKRYYDINFLSYNGHVFVVVGFQNPKAFVHNNIIMQAKEGNGLCSFYQMLVLHNAYRACDMCEGLINIS
jgi:hypothetical protein